MDNLENKLYNALRELGQQAINFIQLSMQIGGPNIKAKGKNTLVGSHLYDELAFEANPDNELVLILINNYYVYVEGGRTSPKWPPFDAIHDWAVDKGLPTTNSFIYFVSKSIVEKGIPPRPFMGEAMEMLEAYYETWADNVFEEIMTGISGFFNN